MTNRELEIPPAMDRPIATLVLKSRANWTAIIFFFTLSFLHFSIAIPAFLKLRWEGYVSAVLAVFFLATTVVVYFCRSLITFDSVKRAIRVRSGVGRFFFQRWISFDDVHAVRLTFSPSDRPRSRIEVLCDNEDIECPPTDQPRQEALCLAMLLDVQLIKVWAESRNCESDKPSRM